MTDVIDDLKLIDGDGTGLLILDGRLGERTAEEGGDE